MCTNFTPTRNGQWVKEHLGVDLPATDYPTEAYPGYAAPIVVRSHQTGRVACGLARFGLIPSWAKDDKIGRHTYNARSETVATKPSYRTPWRLRRYAITLLDSFYEPSYASGKAERWRIELETKQPFGIASIWDTWTDASTGQVVTSFSMLTVNADSHPVMKQFHKAEDEKRTPVILAPSQFHQWLSADQAVATSMMSWELMPNVISQNAAQSRKEK
jgi:putative SOS response-associated peptidase YedK